MVCTLLINHIFSNQTTDEAMKGYDFETGGWQSGAGHFTQVLVFIHQQL